MASTICPRECPCSLKWRERRMRRFDRKWSISSFSIRHALERTDYVDGLVRHAHALVVGIPILQPPGNLLGRPVQNQFTRNDISQLAVHGQQAALGSQSRLPGLSVRIMGTIGRTAAMAYDLSAHCRGGTTQTTGDLANRRVGSDPSRNIFSLSEGKR